VRRNQAAAAAAAAGELDSGDDLLSPLAHYAVFHSLNRLAHSLPTEFGEAHFDFFSRSLEGTTEQQPRWKRVLKAVETALGEALGKLYVEKHFQVRNSAQAVWKCGQGRFHYIPIFLCFYELRLSTV
jgi:predicted metalloendopeptidase